MSITPSSTTSSLPSIMISTFTPTERPSYLSTVPSSTPFESKISSAYPSLSAVSSSIPSVDPSANPSFDPSVDPTTSSNPSKQISLRPSATGNTSLVPTSASISTFPSKQESAELTITNTYLRYPSTTPSESGPCGLNVINRSMMIMERLHNVSSVELLSDTSTPQGKALEWLLNYDEARVCPDAKKLIQRYVLAVMYFSTGGEEWFKCSSNNPKCGDEYPFLNRTKFLSSGSECFWAGIRCSESMCVTQIEFGKSIESIHALS